MRSDINGTERLTLTVEEAARQLGIARGTAYKMCKIGQFPTLRIGKKLVVPKASLSRLLASAEAHAEALREAQRTELKYNY